MTWTWVAQKLALEVENHQQWVLPRLQLFLKKMLMQPLCYQSYKLREKGQAHHKFSQFLNVRIFLRNFLCFVFLQGKSFLSRSKIEIKIFNVRTAPYYFSRKRHFAALSKMQSYEIIPSLDHFLVHNSVDFLCWKYKEVVCFYVSILRQ